MKKILSFVWMFLLVSFNVNAQYTWYCDEYPEFQPRLVQPTQTKLIYYMSSESESSLPPADSVWVIDTTYSCVMTITALEGEPISILELNPGIYLFNIQLGDCVWKKTFFRRRDVPQDIENTAISTSSSLKYLRDGQLFIKSGDEIHTIQGLKFIK